MSPLLTGDNTEVTLKTGNGNKVRDKCGKTLNKINSIPSYFFYFQSPDAQTLKNKFSMLFLNV